MMADNNFVPFADEPDPGDYYETEPEDYAAMPEMGSCDADGCMIMYETTSTFDHCPEEGLCWPHCTDVGTHAPMYGFTPAEVLPSGVPEPEDEPPPTMGQWVLLPKKGDGPDLIPLDPGKAAIKQLVDEVEAKMKLQGDPTAIVDALNEEAQSIESVQEAVAGVIGALAEGTSQDVYEQVNEILGKAATPGYMPTQAERVALFVAGLEAIAVSEHSTLVAYVEGRTLAKHKADYGNECGVCENLDKYMTNALAMLQPIAQQQVAEAQQVAQEQAYIAMGACVDCGQPPVGGRTYSLEKGKGFMCANCAGPFLLMDDGKPGTPWPDQAAQ